MGKGKGLFRWMFSRWHYWIFVAIHYFFIGSKDNQIIIDYISGLLGSMIIIGIFYFIIWAISKSAKKFQKKKEL